MSAVGMVALAMTLVSAPTAFVMARKHPEFGNVLTTLAVYFLVSGIGWAFFGPVVPVITMAVWYWGIAKSREALSEQEAKQSKPIEDETSRQFQVWTPPADYPQHRTRPDDSPDFA